MGIIMGWEPAGYDDSGTDSQAMFAATADGEQFITFPAGEDSNIILKCVPRVPANYSVLTVDITAAMDGANGGDIDFEVYVDAQAADGGALGSHSWDAANAQTTTMPSAANENEPLDDALTNDDSPAEDDILYLKLRRNAASETATDALRVHHVIPIVSTA